MKQKRIAVLFGGSSSEHSVSLASAAGVLAHMDRARYVPVMVGITERGDWYHYTGSLERIAAGTWQDGPDCAPALLSPSAGTGGSWSFGSGRWSGWRWTAFFPFSMAKTGRMVLSRACASWRGFRWWVAAFWPLLCAWIRTGPTGWCRRRGSKCLHPSPWSRAFARRRPWSGALTWATPSL